MSDKTEQDNSELDGTQILKNMLLKIGIKFESIDELEGKVLERDILLLEDVASYMLSFQDKIKDSGYKTGTLTSLHKNNNDKQKWPQVNILRQLLKCNKLRLKPFTKSNGYNKSTGKKNVIRFYRIEKLEN
jgi:hypothetical protein